LTLPRLAYIGDVPVEASYHGSALLHRLLRHYRAEDLRIVETSMHDSDPARRLPAVASSKLDVGGKRLLNTRFHPWVNSWYTLRAGARAANVPASLAGFRPEAVLTVAHGYGWLAAARYARDLRLPLHLIIHDDWPRQTQLPAAMRGWLDGRFGTAYRQARSRFCVSPYMEETYRQQYSAAGSVLLPSRAPDAPSYDAPPERLRRREGPIVYGFGGTINTAGHAQALRQLAAALAPTGDRLAIYGPIAPAQAANEGLEGPNVSLRGLVPATEFIERMRREVDVLFMPMSFEPADRQNMRLCFPSKLTDYTAAGLPILAQGPPDSSGIRWARENAGVAEVVESEGTDDLSRALKKLSSPETRWRLAQAALRQGERDFSHASAQALFFDHLARAAA
jgi:glycosyltransferase involved in cell wall biosynthesis